MVNVQFEKRMNIRIKESEFDKISKVVDLNNFTFDTVSHFVRVSVIKELRRYNEQGGLIE